MNEFKNTLRNIGNFIFEVLVYYVALIMISISVAYFYLMPKSGVLTLLCSILLVSLYRLYDKFFNKKED